MSLPTAPLALAAVLALAAPAVLAATTTVRVEDMGFTSNTNSIEQQRPGFGSSGPVTLDWDPLDASGTRLLNWLGNYSGRDAAWCQSGAGCALDLRVAAGSVVTLDSFWLGAYPNFARTIAYAVVDLADNSVLLSNPGATVPAIGGLTVFAGASSGTGLRIVFGPDGYNGGLNDIVYSSAPIPEPATWALWLSGLAGLGAWARRRRTAA